MRRLVDLVLLVIVLIIGLFAVQNAQTIGDWWHAQRFTASSDVVALGYDAGMNEAGTGLFFRFSPELVDQATLDSHCDAKKLGCTDRQSIYILRSTSDGEYNRNVVTAAHEMLHVAYSRLSQKEKADLEPLLDAELIKPVASGIVEELRGYPKADYYNEAHSFVGSELGTVGPELTSHYNQYFSHREKTTSAYTQSPEDK